MSLWPFKKRPPTPKEPGPTPQDERLMILEHKMMNIEAEWNDVFVKFNRLAGRIERAKGHDETGATVEAPQNSPTVAPAGIPIETEEPEEPMASGTRHDLLKAATT